MAKIKNTSQWESKHKAESERVLAEAEESIRKFGPSKLGQELLAILVLADTEGQEAWTGSEIEKYVNDTRRWLP